MISCNIRAEFQRLLYMQASSHDELPNTDALLERAVRGEASALTQLLDRYRGRLRTMVAIRLDRRLKARIDPSDVVQEVLAEAARGLSEYAAAQPVPFYVWLRGLAWQRLVRMNEQHLKARRRSVLKESMRVHEFADESARLLADRLADSVNQPDHRLMQAELKSRVLAALSRLSERDRELLVLRHLEQVPSREIAGILQCSDAAVRTRHTRALARLAQLIDPE
jgi:RNA polymerase sigma-70 factor (ECF subfamily)